VISIHDSHATVSLRITEGMFCAGDVNQGGIDACQVGTKNKKKKAYRRSSYNDFLKEGLLKPTGRYQRRFIFVKQLIVGKLDKNWNMHGKLLSRFSICPETLIQKLVFLFNLKFI
jgi:hypothetical protein